MVKTKDDELIGKILNRVAQLEPRQLYGIYEMLMSRESYMKGDKVVNLGPRNAEQILVFLEQWRRTGIYKYDEFIIDLLAKVKFRRSRWYLDISEKSYMVEPKKVKEFLADLKMDLEVYIIHVKSYDITMLKAKYLK